MAKSSKKISKISIELEGGRKYSQPSEGALDLNYFVKAQMKEGTWHLAKIIDCRVNRNHDPKKKRTDFSYDYYVHYMDFDRRMDEWLPRARVELTRELIEEDNPNKKKKGEKAHVDKEHEGLDPSYLVTHERLTRFKTINSIRLGKYECDTWYYSPYPLGFQNIDTLFICEFCLNFFVSNEELTRHFNHCKLTHPPGDEIYRHGRNSVFEVDGYKNTTYCENIGYLAKLFLDHKNVYEDTLPFLYYVVTENDEFGQHIVGYFSKEKESQKNWNLACILVLPFHQRKGYGKFLISFSYELSIIEKKPGGPEVPLSDLGRASYVSWWTQRIIQFIREHQDEAFSISDISKETCMMEKDIIDTLEEMKLLKHSEGKLYICTDAKVVDPLYKAAGKPGVEVVADKIQWSPFKYKYFST